MTTLTYDTKIWIAGGEYVSLRDAYDALVQTGYSNVADIDRESIPTESTVLDMVAHNHEFSYLAIVSAYAYVTVASITAEVQRAMSHASDSRRKLRAADKDAAGRRWALMTQTGRKDWAHFMGEAE